MRDPYKVIVAGTGAIGTAVLRELLRRPEFELVGVMGFSKRKEGLDVGEVIGQGAFRHHNHQRQAGHSGYGCRLRDLEQLFPDAAFGRSDRGDGRQAA